MKKVLALGPFIGDFAQEVLTFCPYTRWLHRALDFDKVYLSTHFNRMFLYDFIPEENKIHVFENITRDEIGQKGYTHDTLKQKDFNILITNFTDVIIEKEGCLKKDITLYHLSYAKLMPPYSIYNKIFKRFTDPDIDISEKYKNRIIFIPDALESKERLEYIWKSIEKYDPIIIGNMSSHFPENNVILQNIDYFENGWKYIIKIIMNSKAIICPLSFWTTICNIQNKPVFSWGESVGQYREGGIYYFGNKKSMTFSSDQNTENEKITSMIEYFLKRIK